MFVARQVLNATSKRTPQENLIVHSPLSVHVRFHGNQKEASYQRTSISNGPNKQVLRGVTSSFQAPFASPTPMSHCRFVAAAGRAAAVRSSSGSKYLGDGARTPFTLHHDGDGDRFLRFVKAFWEGELLDCKSCS